MMMQGTSSRGRRLLVTAQGEVNCLGVSCRWPRREKLAAGTWGLKEEGLCFVDSRASLVEAPRSGCGRGGESRVELPSMVHKCKQERARVRAGG